MDDDLPVGINVWAKLQDCRPWPGYVIQKRRPSAKHKNLIPINFFGELEEFAWVEPDNILPLTNQNIVEYSRDCDEDPTFFPAVQMAYSKFTHRCAVGTCNMVFRSQDALTIHISKVHVSTPTAEELERKKVKGVDYCRMLVNTAASSATRRLTTTCKDMLLGMLDKVLQPPLERDMSDSEDDEDDEDKEAGRRKRRGKRSSRRRKYLLL
eukprot:m.81472 g.81472  ORF g.81472 m.81472 type:complete len:210 (-) comp25421_c1_seq2:63-692(-)